MFKITKKLAIFIMFCCFIILCISLASLAQNVKEIKFTTAEMDPTQFAFFEWMVNAYEEMHPEVYITIEKVSMRVESQVFLASIAAGEPMGIFQLRGGEVLEFAPKGVFLPVDTMIDEVGRDNFYSWGYLGTGGKTYGVGQLFNVTGLWSRKDLLEKAGMQTPQTHDEMLEAAKKMTVDNDGDGVIDIYGIAIPASSSAATDMVGRQLFLQKGTDFVDRNLNPILENNPRVINTLNYVAELMKYASPDAAAWDWMGHREAYRSEKAAMAISWGRVLNRIGREQPELANVTNLSIVPGDELNVSMLGGDYYVIASTCENPKETMDFLKWLVTEGILRLCAAVPGHDLPPTKIASNHLLDYIFDNPDIYPEQTDFVKNHSDWIKTFVIDIASLGVNQHTQFGAVYNGEVDRNFVPSDLPPEFIVRITGEPSLTGEMFHKVAYEGISAEDAAAWGQQELLKVLNK